MIEGWIMHFFGQYGKQKFEGFPEMNIEVPILLKNEGTGKKKNLSLVSDWVLSQNLTTVPTSRMWVCVSLRRIA